MDTVQRDLQQYLASTNKIYLLYHVAVINIMNNLNDWSSTGFNKEKNYTKINITFYMN